MAGGGAVGALLGPAREQRGRRRRGNKEKEEKEKAEREEDRDSRHPTRDCRARAAVGRHTTQHVERGKKKMSHNRLDAGMAKKPERFWERLRAQRQKKF